jgi:hypothetical protein
MYALYLLVFAKCYGVVVGNLLLAQMQKKHSLGAKTYIFPYNAHEFP